MEKPLGSPPPMEKTIDASNLGMDKAFVFIAQNREAETEASNVDLKALRRRVDLHVVPIMFMCFVAQFLDKVLLNYAAVMSLNQDLGLKGNDFANANTFTYVALLVAEIPTGLILSKISATKWLSANVFLWGIATAAVAGVHDYHTLLVARIFLGIFEAAVGPCLILISSQWYSRQEQPLRFSIWYCGVGVGQIIGALTSFGFQFVSNNTVPVANWRIMFIVLGLCTVVVGVATYIFLPENPMMAKWISKSEKVALLEHVASNKTGVANHQFKASQVLEVFLDPQVYLLFVMEVALVVNAGVGTSFSATLLRNIGYSSKQSTILNVPSGCITIAAVLLAGIGARFIKQRWLFICIAAIPSALAGALMSFVRTRSGVLAGVLLIQFNVAVTPIMYSWVAANIAGNTKRPIVIALAACAFNLGNVIGPQTFQARDAPQYIPAKITIIATVCSGALVSIALMIYYRWENARRDRKYGVGGVGGERNEADVREDWENMTDRENTTFRYVL